MGRLIFPPIGIDPLNQWLDVLIGRVMSHHLLSSFEGDSLGRKKLYVPRVEDKNSHMRMLRISQLDDLVANSMNILEPSPVGDDGSQREDGMRPFSL